MSRSLDKLPNNSSVMVDANIFVYALTPQAHLHKACQDLLLRGAQGVLHLATSVSVAADVLHRVMVLEILEQGHVQRSAEAVHLLKQQPDIVAGLTRYRAVVRNLRQARVNILALSYRDLHTSRMYREQHGLLVNDSLLVAVMQREHIQFLATNDTDFARIPGIVVRMP